MSYSDNNYGNSSQFPITDTNMFVNMLANSDKLVSESKRWQYDGEKNPELDDDHANYLNNNISEHHTDNNDKEKEKEKINSEHFTDNRSEVRNTETKTEYKTEANSNKDEDAGLTAEELMLRKLDMLRKLSELAQAGVKLSQNYNMNSDYKMMKYEYELHKGIRAKQNGVNWMSSMSLNLIYGMEMLNDKYNPFDLKLKGWSEQMNADINNYYDVFGELYEKYNQPGKNMAPELKLLLMVSGSALKFHLTNTMMSNLPTLNTQLDEDPVLAEQLRQKAIAQKIKEQNQKNSEALKTAMTKEHEQATQKASDLNLIRQKEIEYQNLKRENAQKNAELEALREKLLMSQTQKNTQMNTGPARNVQNQHMPQTIQRQVPPPVNMQQYNAENLQNLQGQQQIQMSPFVQKMLMAKKMQEQQLQEQMTQQYGLANNASVTNKLNNLQAQTNYMEELEKLKFIREKEEEKVKLEKLKLEKLKEEENKRKLQKSSSSSSKSTSESSETSGESIQESSETSTSSSESKNSSRSSKSNVEYNVNLKTILSDTKKNLKESGSSDKIQDLGTVDADEISRSNISLGKKRVKKDKESKDSKDTNKSDKPKTVRQKKTGINF